MSPANTTDPRRRLQPEQRREELVRVGVELFAEGTLDRTHVNEIIKRAGVSRTLFYHYFPSKAAFARAIVEHEILHLHDLVEQQIEPTLEAAISTFAGYVRARPDSFRALHTGGLDQDPEIAAALNTSFERYERLVLMLLGVVEPDERAMFAAKVWIDTMIALRCSRAPKRPRAASRCHRPPTIRQAITEDTPRNTLRAAQTRAPLPLSTLFTLHIFFRHSNLIVKMASV